MTSGPTPRDWLDSNGLTVEAIARLIHSAPPAHPLTTWPEEGCGECIRLAQRIRALAGTKRQEWECEELDVPTFPICYICGKTPATEPWGPCEEYRVCSDCAYLHQGPERDH